MNKERSFLLIVLLFFVFPNTYAQKKDLEKAKLAVDTLFFSDKSKALKISEQQIPNALAANDTFYITYFLDQAGELNRFEGNLYDARRQLVQCLEYKKNWKDLKDLSITHNNLGKTYMNMGDYDLSLHHLLKALKLMEKDKNKLGQAYYLNNIGVMFDLQHNYTKAIEYYKKALNIKEELKDPIGIGASNLNIGISYFNLGEFEMALNFFYEALENKEYAKDPVKLARIYKNIADTYLELKKTEQSKQFLNNAIGLESKIDDQQLKVSIYNSLSKIHLQDQNIDSAVYYNRKALLSTNNSGMSAHRQAALFIKSDIYQHSGKLDSALITIKEANMYFDSLVTENTITAVAEMESKYNNEKNLRLLQKAEVAELKSRNLAQSRKIQLFSLILIFVILLGFTVFIYSKNQSNKKAAYLLKGQNALMDKQNKQLAQINNSISEEMDLLKISLEDKSQILDKVFTKTKENEDLPEDLLSLSPREMEILSHLALGLSDDQLAEKLFISKTTVKTHLRRIYSKLLVRNRAEAVAIAHKYNIIGNTISSVA